MGQKSFSDCYASFREATQQFMLYLFGMLYNQEILGDYSVEYEISRRLAGKAIRIFSKPRGVRVAGMSYAYCDSKPQLFAMNSRSVNYSLEVLKYAKKITDKGWLLNNEQEADIYVVSFVRSVSPTLQARVDRAISGMEFHGEWGKRYSSIMKTAELISKDDICEMEVVFIDRKSVLEWLAANGYQANELMDEAKALRQTVQKGKRELEGIRANDMQLSYTGIARGSQKEAVTLVSNVGFGLGKWVVGRYSLRRDEEGYIQIKELCPFSFDWGRHGHGVPFVW